MSFSTITTRSNGQLVDYSWFEALKAAGVALEGFTGSGYIGETSMTLANGQASAADVTGLVLSAASYTGAIIYMQIRRKTGTNEVIANGLVKIFYRQNTTTWEIIDELSGDYTGVTLSITSAGQVQYVSDTLAGSTYVGLLSYKAMSFA